MVAQFIKAAIISYFNKTLLPCKQLGWLQTEGLWANRAHREAVVTVVVATTVAAAEGVQAVSVVAVFAIIQRARPIVAVGAPAVDFRTVAVARKGQEDAVAVGAGYAVTVNTVKGCPLPSAVVA